MADVDPLADFHEALRHRRILRAAFPSIPREWLTDVEAAVAQAAADNPSTTYSGLGAATGYTNQQCLQAEERLFDLLKQVWIPDE